MERLALSQSREPKVGRGAGRLLFRQDLVRRVRILSDPQTIDRLRLERSNPDPGA
jgi:hypothetical protein